MSERIKELLNLKADNTKTAVKGWIRTSRDSKNIIFIEINDGSCLKNLQLVIEKDKLADTSLIDSLTTGASIKAEGILVSSSGQNQAVELQCTDISVIGPAPADSYPLQKKRHSFEFLREIAHLRPRTNTFGAVARVRSRMSYAIHSFFQSRGFVYVHTPVITASDCEGAGEMFQVTTLPLDKIAAGGKAVDYSRDFFGKKAYLTVSGQLAGETYACALKNIYTFGPTFRAENSNTARHLAEFWMIEPEMAFCDIYGNMDIAEDFLKYVLKDVYENCREDLEFFDKWVQQGVLQTVKEVIEKKFARTTYTEAVDALIKSRAEFEYPVSWGCDLQSEHEKYLTEHIFNGPVIVTGYPKEIKAFYMKENEDGKTVRAMDILVPRLGEIIGGSEREEDLERLTKRITDSGLNPADYWWYLDLRRYGTVPHSGFGLGFERLILYVTGMANIRDVIPYPRTPKSADF
jgi:asparaginyl-tRNA synthetase